MSYDGSPAYRTLKASLDDCCSACTSDNAHNKPCELYTRSFWGECSLYTNVSFSNLKPSVGSSSGYFSGAGISAYVQVRVVVVLVVVVASGGSCSCSSSSSSSSSSSPHS